MAKKKRIEDVKAWRKWKMDPVQKVHSSRRRPEVDWEEDLRHEDGLDDSFHDGDGVQVDQNPEKNSQG